MNDESENRLDDWGKKIAALEPAVVEGATARAQRLAADDRLQQSDRDFAQAQVDALQRSAPPAASIQANAANPDTDT